MRKTGELQRGHVRETFELFSSELMKLLWVDMIELSQVVTCNANPDPVRRKKPRTAGSAVVIVAALSSSIRSLSQTQDYVCDRDRSQASG